MNHKTALIAGATGVVGRELVRQLCAHPAYGKIIVWARRPPDIEHPKLDVRIIDFAHIAAIPAEPLDEIYCALGTTIKQAGSRAAFLKVDVEYPAALGAWGRRAGVPHFLLVSAPNADPEARLFYPKAKGLAEQALRACAYPALDIFHPPLIAGERADKRRAETLAIRLFACLPRGWLADWRPMSGSAIAQEIIAAAQHRTDGTRIHRLRAPQ